MVNHPAGAVAPRGPAGAAHHGYREGETPRTCTTVSAFPFKECPRHGEMLQRSAPEIRSLVRAGALGSYCDLLG